MSADANYKSSELYKIRHSCAHVLAQAVLEVFPEAKLGIGPPIKDGFYYDFDLPRTLNPEDLSAIEKRMKRIIRSNHSFELATVSEEEAMSLFADQPYKIELIERIVQGDADENGEELADEQAALTTYKQDSFLDLCAGPHVASTGKINHKAVKLLHVAGAYWKGDSSNKMLQRIYGTAWESPDELNQYIKNLEEAKKRDHRNLGKSLELFDTSDEVGRGLILWQPKGAMVRYLAERFSQEAHLLNGYQWVYTPHIGRSKLWETSGHLEFYKDAMYPSMELDEGETYYLKPMNCPFHIQIYKKRPRSYNELPMRLAEFGTVYRYELSGALHGLTRVRGFTQDDAHIFCTEEQAEMEIRNALRFSIYVLKSFGFEKFEAFVSTRPEDKSIGTDENWENATAKLENAVKTEGLKYDFDPGGGAFYGPKVDLKVIDSIGREWQLSTVQFDFNLPERFDMSYVGSDGMDHRPYMIHRALFGSAERFFGMLTEHHAGAFPLWLAPTQVMIIPITDQHIPYCKKVEETLNQNRFRAETDASKERMQHKIRTAVKGKIPYVFVVGDKEMEENTVAVRGLKEGDQGSMTLEDFFSSVESQLEAGMARAI